MYKVTTETEDGTRTDLKETWFEVLKEGYCVGFAFTVAGLCGLLFTPFVAIHAAYDQWKNGNREKDVSI